MSEEKDFFKTCFNTVAGLEVKNESQAIAKEVVLSEIENLQQANKQLKDNWAELKKYIKTEIPEDVFIDTEWFVAILDKMLELERGINDIKD